MDDRLWKIEKSVSFWAMSALVAGGCTAPHYAIPDSFRASSQAEAGTLLVSPTMVAPWDEVAAALKPAFVLTGDQAAAQVLPTTESISEQVLSSFGASLAAGLPTTATTSKTTIGGVNSGTTTTTDKAPGTAPAISNTLPSSASLPAGSTTSGALGLDPGLKYAAANYLLQKVQLLNQEIDNAAARSCYVPYVVKLKLATMNYRPRLPYSVHAHIGFNYNGALNSETRASVDQPTDLTAASNELAPECSTFGTNPAVIPFLAADDVQVALHSRAAEAASQIAVGLSALVHGVGLAANAGAINESLTAISNHEFTSTLTVGRESESSLYVLITPNNQSSNQAALASQTYDVAVLVLIPRFYFGGAFDPQSPVISVATFSEYRDASTGAILTDGGRSMLVQQGDRIIVPHLTPEGLTTWSSLSPDEKYDQAKRLANTIKQGSMMGLVNRLECKPEKNTSAFCRKLNSKPGFVTTYPAALWADFASLLDYDNEKLALFQARLPTPIALPSQQVVLSDDGTKPLQALLGGVSGRSMAKVTAFLNVTPFDIKTWERRPTLKIPAQSLTFDGSAHTLALYFPSLKKLNITCLSPAEIPPRPSAPPKPIKKAKTNSDSPAKPELPDCPQDSEKTAAEEPNRIVLSLTGCDATREVCPLLTDTVLNEADYVRQKGSELARYQRWVAKDVKVNVKGAQERLDTLNSLVQRWDTVAKAQIKAVAALRKTPKADTDAVMQDFYNARTAAYDTARSLGLEQYLGEPATLSVYLAPPPPAPDAPTVTFSNVGPAIDVEKGAGQLVFTIAATPASDTIGISVKGASIKSVMDSTDTAIPFSAKHGFVLPRADVYTLSLTDIKEKVPVVLSAQALKGDAADGSAVTQSFETTSSSAKTPPAKGNNSTK